VAVLLFAALAVLAAAERVPVDSYSQSLISEDQQSTLGGSVSDEALLVRNRFGGLAVNMENLKAFIAERRLNDVGTIDDLIPRTACVMRLEDIVGSKLSPQGLQTYLTDRALSLEGNTNMWFDRSCDYLSKELKVRDRLGADAAGNAVDLSVSTLKSALASLGFIRTSGTKPELIYRLGKAYRDIEAICGLMKCNEKSFDTSTLAGHLNALKLSSEGTTDVLLGRLAQYLVTKSENTVPPGVSQHCDMVVESGICLSGGKKVFVSDAIPKGLVGKWTFDDMHMLDHSGSAIHSKEAVPFGPGLNGMGQSAKFDGNTMLEIPHDEKLSNSNFCMTMWLYLLTDSTGQWRTIFHKGTRDHERTPALFLEPQTRGLEFFVSTTDENQPAGERVWSNTFIPLRSWTHIAACAEGRNLRLYINGILDAENTTVGSPILNKGPLYVGNDPWRPSSGIAGYVDELRYYVRTLSTDEIQAEASSALGLVEPAFVELGCMGCALDSCPKACRKGFRMCTQRDLYSGGYFVARHMGWAASDTKIWSAEDGKISQSSNDKLSGLCMCCRISESA